MESTPDQIKLLTLQAKHLARQTECLGEIHELLDMKLDSMLTRLDAHSRQLKQLDDIKEHTRFGTFILKVLVVVVCLQVLGVLLSVLFGA